MIGLTGGHAAALAMKQINPDVVAVYPITPQTPIIEKFSEYVANKQVNTELVTAESEHSAMSICIGSSASGARTMTATSSNGLALMIEPVYIASSYRLPIVMNLANRAISGPINIHCDHSDAMLMRDSGWIQLFSENPQEVYDNNIIAIKIAEKALLPVAINQDGFITSHSLEPVDILSDTTVKDFVGVYKPRYSLLKQAITIGPLDLYDYYFEHKRQQAEAMKESMETIKRVMKQYSSISNREINVLHSYKAEDADTVFIAMNSTAGTLRVVIDKLRSKGVKAGLVKIRVYRPFPMKEIRQLLRDKEKIIVLDRAISYGTAPPLFQDIRSALYGEKPVIISYVYGLGGREFTVEQGLRIYEQAKTMNSYEFIDNYMGVRE